MNGLEHLTATLGPTITGSNPIFQSTTTLRCWAGSVTPERPDIHTSRPKARLNSINISTWLGGICVAAVLEGLSLSPPLLSLYQLCLCIPFSAHLFSPKQPYAYSGSLELAAWHVFRLAVGLISAAYLSPGQINTHWQTHTHLHALQRQQVVLAVCWDTWRKRSIRKKDASHYLPPRCATLQQRLITVPSAQLSWGFPKYIFQLKLTQAERGKLSFTQFRHRFFSLFDQKPQPNSLIFQVLRGV